MPEISIDSIDDPRLEPYRHLKQRNLTRHSGLFIAEGMRLVQRLLDSDFSIHSILASPAHARRIPDEIRQQVPVYLAPLPLLENVIGFQFHSGMLACGHRKPGMLLADWLPTGDRPLLIVGCPQVSDPDNLGTLIRTAAAFGADGLMVGKSTADPFSRRTLRISMGNAFFLPIYESVDFSADMQQMQQEFGITAVATLLAPDARPLSQVQRPPRMLLLMGNEDEGLDPKLADRSDIRVTIPMAEKIDSLNVGIAAGIMLHHFTQVSRLEKEEKRNEESGKGSH